jgi:hypothetical protein
LHYKLERLQNQLNVYWKQEAHNAWLLKGDRNTDFLHAFASKRKTRNYVRKLWDDNGNVVEGKHLKNFITNQYIELFTSHGGDQFDEVLNCVESRVAQDMNDVLLEPFIGDEI